MTDQAALIELCWAGEATGVSGEVARAVANFGKGGKRTFLELDSDTLDAYGRLLRAAGGFKWLDCSVMQVLASSPDAAWEMLASEGLAGDALAVTPLRLSIDADHFHWVLIVLDCDACTVSALDSALENGAVWEPQGQHLAAVISAATGKEWTCRAAPQQPQQSNRTDCGVFVLEYARRVSAMSPRQWRALAADEMHPMLAGRLLRRRMTLELVQGVVCA